MLDSFLVADKPVRIAVITLTSLFDLSSGSCPDRNQILSSRLLGSRTHIRHMLEIKMKLEMV